MENEGMTMNYKNTELTDLMGEVWRPVTGYEGIYEVSNLGRVKSLKRRDCINSLRQARILRQNNDSDGYLMVNLCKDRGGVMAKVHRIVAAAFVVNVGKLPAVNHTDGNKKNNCVQNLEWCTNHQNILHAIETGLRNHRGEDNPASKLTNAEVLDIYNSPLKLRHICAAYPNVTSLAISRIRNGYSWSSVTGHQKRQRNRS